MLLLADTLVGMASEPDSSSPGAAQAARPRPPAGGPRPRPCALRGGGAPARRAPLPNRASPDGLAADGGGPRAGDLPARLPRMALLLARHQPGRVARDDHAKREHGRAAP